MYPMKFFIKRKYNFAKLYLNYQRDYKMSLHFSIHRKEEIYIYNSYILFHIYLITLKM